MITPGPLLSLGSVFSLALEVRGQRYPRWYRDTSLIRSLLPGHHVRCYGNDKTESLSENLRVKPTAHKTYKCVCVCVCTEHMVSTACKI